MDRYIIDTKEIVVKKDRRKRGTELGKRNLRIRKEKLNKSYSRSIVFNSNARGEGKPMSVV